MAVFPGEKTLRAAIQRTQDPNPDRLHSATTPRVVPPPDGYAPRTPISYRALEVQLSEAGSCLLKPRRHQPDFRFSFRGDCDSYGVVCIQFPLRRVQLIEFRMNELLVEDFGAFPALFVFPARTE